jgi:energy-coupling factor transporter ATP-binding protein EcfA2
VKSIRCKKILRKNQIFLKAGPAGSGKSTLAASLLEMGYSLVADDCVALQEKEQKIYAIPAYPGLRLWEDSNARLFGENGNKKRVAHYTRKVRVNMEETSRSYSPEPAPLVRLYDIIASPETDQTPDISIQKLSALDSLMAFIRCAFRLDITDQKMLVRQFHFLQSLAARVSVRRLAFPRDFTLLPAVREAIVNDLKDLPVRQTAGPLK